MIPSERYVNFTTTPEEIMQGWSAEISPRSVAVIFPPSYWRLKTPEHIDRDIEALADAIRQGLRRVLGLADGELK